MIGTIIKFKKLHKGAIIPQYQTMGASGFDLHSLLPYRIMPGGTVLIRTGLACALPLRQSGQFLEMQIRPRSGVSLNTKLRIANTPGTVDSDYRGEICIIAENIGTIPINIEAEERIAQGVIVPVVRAMIEEVDDLDETLRGAGAFGSTGK